MLALASSPSDDPPAANLPGSLADTLLPHVPAEPAPSHSAGNVLNPREVADLYNVSIDVVYNWLHTGILPAVDLSTPGGIFERHGDIPFVHWHHYERTRLDVYVQRYGDHDDVAARVRRNLLDLLPIMRDAIALPLPSYSLKLVERHIGFARSQEEYGGDWAIARYIQACETQDADLRQRIMGEILKYNEEDPAATWAVLQWLSSKGATA